MVVDAPLFRVAQRLDHYEGLSSPRPDDDGRPTITFAHESPACLDDIFHVYQEAICKALTGRGVDPALSEFLMLPFISVRSLDADRHSQVGQLLAKHIRADDISTADTRNPDFYTTPVIETYAGVVWASPACVVQIASTTFRQQALDAVNDGEASGEPWLHAETATGLALDVALLRSGLTSRLAQRLANTSASEIEAISRSALAHHELLSGERLLNAGELAIIEEKLLDLHDFTRRGEALQRQRELAQGVAVADESRNSQRIARRIERIVAGLTIAVALPGVFGVLLQIGTWNHRFPIAGRTFEDWAPYIVAIPIVMVAAAGIAFLIWSTISLLRRRLRARNIRPLVALPQAPRRTAAPFPLGGLRFVPADEPDDEHE